MPVRLKYSSRRSCVGETLSSSANSCSSSPRVGAVRRSYAPESQRNCPNGDGKLRIDFGPKKAPQTCPFFPHRASAAQIVDFPAITDSSSTATWARSVEIGQQDHEAALAACASTVAAIAAPSGSTSVRPVSSSTRMRRSRAGRRVRTSTSECHAVPPGRAVRLAGIRPAPPPQPCRLSLLSHPARCRPHWHVRAIRGNAAERPAARVRGPPRRRRRR